MWDPNPAHTQASEQHIVPGLTEEEKVERVSAIRGELKQSSVDEIGHRKTAELLQELRQLTDSRTLDDLIQATECEMFLGRGNQKTDLLELRARMRSPSNSSLIAKMPIEGAKFLEAGRHVLALIMFWVWCDLHEVHAFQSDVAVRWLTIRVEEIATVSELLIREGGRSRGIAIEFGLKKMEALLQKVAATAAIDLESKALRVGKCAASLAKAYRMAKMYVCEADAAKCGIQALMDALKEKASERAVYAKLLNCAGSGYKCAGELDLAARYFVRAEQACAAATDFSSDRERRNEMEIAREGTREARRNE